MSTEAFLVIIAIAIILIIGGACGFVIGKNSEGKRWSKAANKELVEFEKHLYEVLTADLEKPINYDK